MKPKMKVYRMITTQFAIVGIIIAIHPSFQMTCLTQVCLTMNHQQQFALAAKNENKTHSFEWVLKLIIVSA